MSRFLSTTSLQVTGAAVPSVITRFLQSASAADLEAQLTALQLVLADGGYFLSHLDLAGGGDGHTFVLHTQWAIPGGAGITFTNGGDPGNFILLFYQAAQAAALAVARAACQLRVAALFTGAVATLTEDDTYLAGAQMGTRYMGAVMTSRAFIG